MGLSKSNRATALAEALRSSGFACHVERDVVQLVAPEHTTACVLVGADAAENGDGYRCSFVALPNHAPKLARVWADWTASVRECVAAAWARVEPLALAVEIPATKPPPAAEPEHAWPLHVLVEDALAVAYQAASREGRFAVVREWQTWDGIEAPRVTWHAWAREVAAELGVGQGWAGIAGESAIDASHPAAPHVRRVLVEAAQRIEAPAGIVALDVRGLTLATVEALVRGLVDAARSRCCNGWTRGGIILCDPQTAFYLGRCVDLDAS